MLIKNYITTGLRHIYRQKLFSIINIFGLAIGLSCVMLIALFVRDEINYDTFWTKADDIYRVQSSLTAPGRDPETIVGVPGPVFHLIKDYFPQITYAARIAREKPTIIINGNAFLEDVSFADPEIINIFDFNVIAGDLETSIKDTNSLIINKTNAAKYFPDASAIGQVITISFSEYSRDYKIGAVIEDMPTNSQLNITALVAIDEPAWSGDSIFKNFFAFKSHLYYALKPGADIGALNERMDGSIC